MTEKLLHFVWQFGYFNKSSLYTTAGESVTVLFPGQYNKNQGPDFTAAKIRIGNVALAGTVELHLKTSDWEKHGHESDENYRNVVLHVVYEHDRDVNDVPVLALASCVPNLLLDRYEALMQNPSFIACDNQLTGVNDLAWSAWKERLLAERLTRKADAVLRLHEHSNHHWEETTWWMICRSFGGKINGDAFEAVGRSIPVNLLAKHKTSIHQLEALLLGQAGLLDQSFTDPYPLLLQREYSFLKKKYNLQPSALPVLFLRMRPGSFPGIRLAQLAALVHQTTHLFSKILETESLPEIRKTFSVTANDFWHSHYTFHQSAAFKHKTVGNDAVNGLIINTVVPVLFAYGNYQKADRYKEKALRWLETLPAENNQVVKNFVALGVKVRSAYDTQALLELKAIYCEPKRCLECAVGASLLREASRSYTVASRG